MEIGADWVFNARIELRNHAQNFLFALQRVEERKRALPSNGQWHDCARKKNRVPERQYR
jgi:hypothetical protein